MTETTQPDCRNLGVHRARKHGYRAVHTNSASFHRPSTTKTG